LVKGGDIIGTVFENSLFDEHRIMIPPKIKGVVTKIQPQGSYTIKDELLELEYEGKKIKIIMAQ